MQANLTDVRQRWNKAKPTKTVVFWIVLAAIALTVVFGFTRGGWVTGGTSAHEAALASQGAVVDRLVPMCVAQFNQDPAKEQKLEELQAMNSAVQRSTFVADQGWATMPGETTPDGKIATECGKQLKKIGE